MVLEFICRYPPGGEVEGRSGVRNLGAIVTACLIAVISIGQLTSVWAQTDDEVWEKLPSSEFGPEGIVEVNWGSVEREGDLVFVQIRYRTRALSQDEMREIEQAGLERLPSEITMTQGYDCGIRKFTTIAASFTGFDGLKEEMPAPPQAEFEEPVEGSVNQYLIATLC